MRRVPDTWLFEPWLMPPEVQRHCGLTVGLEIPQPVVDLAQATRTAKAALHARRAEPEVRAGKKAVVEQHASRRGLSGQGGTSTGTSRRKTASKAKASTTTPPSNQLGFDF
jgi:deoxyribodipyrimidine photo-lyase